MTGQEIRDEIFFDLQSRADADPEKCGCHGSGWMLSDLDTWEMCPRHGFPWKINPEEQFEGDVVAEEARRQKEYMEERERKQHEPKKLPKKFHHPIMVLLEAVEKHIPRSPGDWCLLPLDEVTEIREACDKMRSHYGLPPVDQPPPKFIESSAPPPNNDEIPF